MPSRLVTVIIVALLLPGLAGCTSWRGERPDVILTNLEVLDSTMFEQRLRAHLRIVNPNDFQLDISGLDITLDVNDVRLARGVSPLSVSVPRLSDATTTLDVSTTVFDLVRQAVAVTERSTFDYRVRGKVHLAGLGGTVRFHNDGTLGSWTLPGIDTFDPMRPSGIHGGEMMRPMTGDRPPDAGPDG